MAARVQPNRQRNETNHPISEGEYEGADGTVLIIPSKSRGRKPAFGESIRSIRYILAEMTEEIERRPS